MKAIQMDHVRPKLVFEFQQPFARRRDVFPWVIHPIQFVITFDNPHIGD